MEPTVEVGGFVESYYSYNLGDPDNGVTALRGFDQRHDSFSLSLASLSAELSAPVAHAKVALQVGPTADAYWAAEPRFAPVREAFAGATAPVLDGLAVDGGVFLSPVGYDGIAVKDNHFWSLSNLGVGLPFTFTGVRATQSVDRTTLVLGVFNGWNRLQDQNGAKTVLASAGHAWEDGPRFQLLYVGGVESGDAWRHTFDGWVDAPVGPALVFAGADGGFESRDAGTYTWQAAQVGAEVMVHPLVSVGLRGDVFREDAPEGVAGHVFWPTTTLGEITGSLGLRPADGLLARLEVRHDRAADPVFFRGGDLDPSATDQTTLTLGVTGWFDARFAP